MYNVQYNLEGKNIAETGIFIVERKLYFFARLCWTSMTVAVTRSPPSPPPPLPAQCRKPINIETGRKG